jgi:hypothetical protein
MNSPLYLHGGQVFTRAAAISELENKVLQETTLKLPKNLYINSFTNRASKFFIVLNDAFVDQEAGDGLFELLQLSLPARIDDYGGLQHAVQPVHFLFQILQITFLLDSVTATMIAK